MDNDPATIRFVYIVSPYTGQVILSATMKGKVTSSNKRLTPASLSQSQGTGNGIYFPIGGQGYYTQEVAGDDGTYGTSAEYIYGFSLDGSMQQIYTGGSLVIVSTKPLTISHGALQMQYVDQKGNAIQTT